MCAVLSCAVCCVQSLQLSGLRVLSSLAAGAAEGELPGEVLVPTALLDRLLALIRAPDTHQEVREKHTQAGLANRPTADSFFVFVFRLFAPCTNDKCCTVWCEEKARQGSVLPTRRVAGVHTASSYNTSARPHCSQMAHLTVACFCVCGRLMHAGAVCSAACSGQLCV